MPRPKRITHTPVVIALVGSSTACNIAIPTRCEEKSRGTKRGSVRNASALA